MENLIPVNYDAEQPTVSARDLHGALGVSKRFSVWFEVNSQGFAENEDFTSVLSSTVVNNGALRELQDYKLSVGMAHLFNVQNRKRETDSSVFHRLRESMEHARTGFCQSLKIKVSLK